MPHQNISTLAEEGGHHIWKLSKRDVINHGEITIVCKNSSVEIINMLHNKNMSGILVQMESTAQAYKVNEVFVTALKSLVACYYIVDTEIMRHEICLLM